MARRGMTQRWKGIECRRRVGRAEVGEAGRGSCTRGAPTNGHDHREDVFSEPFEADSDDVISQFMVEYLQQNTPEGTLEEVYRVAGESWKAATHGGQDAWTPYARRRSLLEAAGVVLGAGPRR